MDRDELTYLFEDAASAAEILPGLDFRQALTAFEAAFLQAAQDEEILHDAIQTGQLLRQSHLQQEILTSIRKLTDFLKEAHLETLEIHAGEIAARHRDDNRQIVYQLQPAVLAAPAADWEEFYLRTLISKCEALDLTQIDETLAVQPDDHDDDRISVSKVFTTLYLAGENRSEQQDVAEAILHKDNAHELANRDRDEKRLPISGLEAVAALPRLVILGQPGGGKSTLVNYIASQLAQCRLGKNGSDKQAAVWPHDDKPLPLRIILRRFAAWIPAERKSADAGLVWDYIKHQLTQWGCQEVYTQLKMNLTEHGGIIFFDGLDEVRMSDEETKRQLIRDAIKAFAAPLNKCRIVITCREYAYQQIDRWRLPETLFPVVRLALFEQEQRAAFIRTWYRVIAPQKQWHADKVKLEADNLIAAVESLPHLCILAQYPLLLTLMAQMHGRDDYLPEDRADLYKRAVILLLAHWDNRIVRDIDGSRTVEAGLVMQLGVRTETLLAALEQAAFAAHERQEKDSDRSARAADIPKEDLRDELKKELKSLDKADQVLLHIQTRAGLLLARDNRTYAFPHRTFQEYLAARYILKQPELDTMLKERVRRDLNWWREVFLLAAGASRNTPRNISDMIEALVWQDVNPQTLKNIPLAQIEMCARALAETDFARHVTAGTGEAEPNRFSRLLVRIQNWLALTMCADEQFSAPERAVAGNALARIEPRLEVTTVDHMQFCCIPAGSFWMGSDDSAKDAYKSEKLQHLNKSLNYDYWMSRYPVTVAQYQIFVHESGHKPVNSDCLKDPANRPVRYVTWNEAIRFCQWLTEKWRQQDRLSRDFAFRSRMGKGCARRG